jgi:hypothetical protein
MTSVAASRWLGRAGFAFLCIAILIFGVQGELTKPSGRGELLPDNLTAFIILPVFFWMSGSLGALLLVGSALLRLRWWYSWLAFFAIGVFLSTMGPKLVGPSFLHVGQSLLFSLWDFVIAVIGVAFILAGFAFLAAQWLVRREPR